jgi:hypothetical protein
MGALGSTLFFLFTLGELYFNLHEVFLLGLSFEIFHCRKSLQPSTDAGTPGDTESFPDVPRRSWVARMTVHSCPFPVYTTFCYLFFFLDEFYYNLRNSAYGLHAYFSFRPSTQRYAYKDFTINFLAMVCLSKPLAVITLIRFPRATHCKSDHV